MFAPSGFGSSEPPLDRRGVKAFDLDDLAPRGLSADDADSCARQVEGRCQELDERLVRTTSFRRRRDPRLPPVAVASDDLAPSRAWRDGDTDPAQSSLTMMCLTCV
jgi:hypothetical protein